MLIYTSLPFFSEFALSRNSKQTKKPLIILAHFFIFITHSKFSFTSPFPTLSFRHSSPFLFRSHFPSGTVSAFSPGTFFLFHRHSIPGMLFTLSQHFPLSGYPVQHISTFPTLSISGGKK